MDALASRALTASSELVRVIVPMPRSYAPPATAGTPSRPRRTPTAASTRRWLLAATTAACALGR